MFVILQGSSFGPIDVNEDGILKLIVRVTLIEVSQPSNILLSVIGCFPQGKIQISRTLE